MMSFYAPFTGFGDDQDSSIKFTIEHPRAGLPQPGSSARAPQLVTTGGKVITQYRGRTPWVWSWTLWFASEDDFEHMDSLQGRRATLRCLANLTPRMGGHVESILDVQYLVLPGTKLMSLVREPMTDITVIEATATFERPYTHTGDRYGLAHYS